MKLSGFHVSVHSNGRELKEYDSIEISPDGKKATCWIPSQIGKVRWVWIQENEASDPKLRRLRRRTQDEAKSVAPQSYRGSDQWCIRCGQGDATIYVYRDSENRFGLPSRSKKLHLIGFVFLDRSDEDKGHDNSDVKLDDLGTISVRLFPAESWRKGKADLRPKKYKTQDHPQAVSGANSERKEKPAEHCLS